MAQINSCPDCGKKLFANVRSCTCGWNNSNEQREIFADHQCRYQHKSRRCPLPGGISPQPYGNGPWYCGGHWRTLSDPKLAEAVLLDAEKNYRKILEEQSDWRRHLHVRVKINEK